MKNLGRTIAGLAVLGFSVSALAWDKMQGVGKAELKGVATVTADWVKDKKEKYDVNLKLANTANKTILMFVGDIQCKRGEVVGKVDIHSDKRVVDLRSTENRDLLLTCRFEKEQMGDFSVTFKVFDNPSNDSTTPGKEPKGTIVWKQGQTEGKKL